MPWKETCPVDERVQFIAAWLRRDRSLSSLCRFFEISRQCGHKWISRYEEGGPPALEERSRAPKSNSRATLPEVVELVLALRERWGWGAKKLGPRLREEHPDLDIPGTSTISGILKRAGVVKPQRRRRRAPPRAQPLAHCREPNDVWAADFKGDFKMGDGSRCYPLTITDACSRFLLCCKGFERINGLWVRQAYERVFREFGVPKAIRTDNGTPFASCGAGGLTKLSVWLVKVGVALERIDPGRPDQNGRHERMHRTLKAQTARPPKRCLGAQQAAFNRFRWDFNEERPHEALGQIPPARVYRRSLRPFPRRIEGPTYPGHFEVRKVYPVGQILFRKKRLVFIGKALAGEWVGLEEYDEGLWRVVFGSVNLGYIDERDPKPKLIRPRRR